MKAFLLAGGFGERLRPLTLTRPKCLAPINGVPLLEIWLRHCASQGIDDVLLNVSQHPSLVADYLARQTPPPIVRLVTEEHPRGTASTVLAERRFVEHESSFWILYSDNLTDVSLGDMRRFHDTHAGPVTVGLFRAPDPRAAGIVSIDQAGRLTAFEEKPASPRGNLASAGIYLARPSLFYEFPPQGGLLDFGHDVLPRLVGRGYGFELSGFLMDIGTPETLAAASQAWRVRQRSDPS